MPGKKQFVDPRKGFPEKIDLSTSLEREKRRHDRMERLREEYNKNWKNKLETAVEEKKMRTFVDSLKLEQLINIRRVIDNKQVREKKTFAERAFLMFALNKLKFGGKPLNLKKPKPSQKQ